jgi:RHS repeat-associated protein
MKHLLKVLTLLILCAGPTPLPAAPLAATLGDGKVILTWEASDGLLEQSADLAGPWTVVPDAKSPWSVSLAEARNFFRLRQDNGPRLRAMEPSIITPDESGGAAVYVSGRNLNNTLRLRLNGQVLTGTELIDGALFKATLPALGEGSYRLELLDEAGNVISQLWPALNIVNSLADKLSTPPGDAPGECLSCDGLPKEPEHLRLFSGEVHYTNVDMRLRGRGVDVVWQRTYRSRIGPSTPQGHGWDHSYNIYLSASGANLVLHDGHGRADRYFPQADGSFGRPELSRRLRANPDGSFTLEFADRAEWDFLPLNGSPAAGKIVRLADRNRNRLAFTYDAAGRLSVITDSLERDLLVGYNAAGFLESLTDFSGRTVRYEYYSAGDADGGAGDLKTAISPVVVGLANGNNFPNGKATRYTYSTGFADDRLNHNLLTIVDPKNQTWLRNTYATTQNPADLLFDRAIRQVHGNAGDIIDVTYRRETPTPANDFAAVYALVNDREGNVTEHLYDLRNRLLAHRIFTGRADPDQPTTVSANRPANPLRPADPPFFETRFGWTENSKLARILHPGGGLSERTYESDLNPQASWRDRGNLRMIRRTPNASGADRSLLIETLYYDAALAGCCGSNFPAREFDANGNRTQHFYDDRGNRIRTVHPVPGMIEEWEYNEFGQMTAHIHPDNGSGHRQRDEFLYHEDGPEKGYLAAKITDATNLGATLVFEYDARGNLIRSTDAKGRVSTASFNALDQLVQDTTREVSDGTGIRYQRDYYYDANDNRIRKDHLNLDENGNARPNTHLSIQFQFDMLNEEIREIREIDPGRNVVTETVHDANRRVILRRSGEATGGDLNPATSGAQPFNVVAMAYDERGLQFRRSEAAGSARQRTSQIDYTLDGNPAREWEHLEGAADSTRYDYDGFRRLIRRTDSMGNVASFTYDANGNLIRERIDGELLDVPGSAGNVRLREKELVYDAMNRVVLERTARFDPATQQAIGDGWATTTTEYTPRSNLRRITDDNGNSITLGYDSANRLAATLDAKGNTVAREYDLNGNLITIVETAKSDAGRPARSFTRRHEYDNLNRRVATIDPLGNRTTMTYDSYDNLTSLKDPKGNVTRFDYDGHHRIVRQLRMLTADGTGNTPVQSTIVTTQVWDDNSRLIAQTDGNSNTTRYAYDELDRLIVTRLPDATLLQVGRGAAWPNATAAPDLSAFESGYDHEDHPALVTDANGTTIVGTYDALGRLTGKQITPGTGVSADTTSEQFQYDGVSRLVRATDDDSEVQRGYDSAGNVTREILNGQSTTTQFDGVGNPLHCVSPSAFALDFGWDELNRMKTLADSDRQLAHYGYFGRNQVETLLLPGTQAGQTRLSGWNHDGAQRLQRVTHTRNPAGTPAVLFDVEIAYDANDNPTRRTVSAGLPTEEILGYDSVNRLVRNSEQAPGGSPFITAYTLDSAGNRSTVQKGPNSVTYQANNPLNQYNQTPWATQTHDLNGNLVQQASLQAQRSFEYDYANRLVRATTPTSISRYAYDPLGRRIGKVVTGPAGENSSETRYYYLGDRILEYHKDGEITRLLPGARPDELVGMRRGQQDFRFHADDLDNIVAVTDAAGTVVESYAYDDFGVPTFFNAAGQPVAASVIGNISLFQGRPYDPETGFHQFRHRYLDPLTGRFLTRDPLGTWGDPLNLGNAYTYAGNNPNRFVDPTGLSSTTRDSYVSSKDVWLTVKFTDCSTSKMDNIEDNPDYLSNTFASLEDAHDDVHAVNNSGTPAESSTLSEMKRWFSGSGSGGSLDSGDKDDIHDVLWGVEDHMRDKTIKFECETSSNNTCDGANAYVPWGSNTLHLCPNFWTQSDDERAAIIFHEMTHAYEGTDDKGYVSGNKTSGTPTYVNSKNNSVTLTKKKLLKNADTYEEFLQNTWLP